MSNPAADGSSGPDEPVIDMGSLSLPADMQEEVESRAVIVAVRRGIDASCQAGTNLVALSVAQAEWLLARLRDAEGERREQWGWDRDGWEADDPEDLPPWPATSREKAEELATRWQGQVWRRTVGPWTPVDSGSGQ